MPSHLKQIEAIAAPLKRAKPHPVEAVGAWGSGKTLLAVQTAEALDTSLVIIAPGRIEAEAIYDDLCTFAGEDNAALFPAWEVLPSDTMDPADDIVAERMNTLQRLTEATEKGETLHVVLPLRAYMQYTPDRKRLLGDALTLRAGEEFSLETLLERLIKMGYTREVMVENRGDVSVRGGIVDIFPISSELPFRLEFFGDELESIRRFEPETQRSIDAAEEMRILPRSEKALLADATHKHQTVTVLTDYCAKGTVIVFDEPLAIGEEGQNLANRFTDSPYYMDWDETENRLNKFRRLALAQVAPAKSAGVVRVTTPMNSISGWAGHTSDFWEQLDAWIRDDYAVQLLCVNSGERRRLHELLEERGYRLGQDTLKLSIDIGRIRAGFASPQDKLVVLSEKEMFGRHYVRRTRRRFEAGQAITQFSDLKSGDYIVHAEHGIGHYLGLRRFEGRSGDFMAVQYRGGDTVYVPVTHIDQVQKYVAGEGAVPTVDKVGGSTWARSKAKVKKAVKDLTEELVKLYAAREAAQGHAYPPDTPWQREFEESFQYDETPDQLRAITDVKRDMESSRPMDRLLCGDVGYGKTEVALRAAFKAVNGGKQVAVLAPTTVLTQQHYATFCERMADFPVTIELLNRFRTAKEQKATVERLKSGEVDIVVGTHRLVSKDIQFKNLGLIIVDEEQRFGVQHKERLKQLRHHVDALAMSATPIPRTLHFSLIGVRDMSVINTAPNDRLPIHTCVEAWDENLIREAIERELDREGQAFFLHNRVQTIGQIADMIRRLVPRARVAVGHGQMAKHDLEDVMTAFIDKKVNVLVCTTIIGSGIDIPNANTIIIDRADHFGLSELYQIRGRVGRYKHRAFAYLLVPGDRALTEDAQQRLKALEEFSNLGSGFRIAMRDLEIRGAGNLLGGEQSGHIASVGYETYRELIAEAVAEHRGEPVRKRALPPFEITADAFIPDDYVPTAMQKMTLYRRISGVADTDEVDELRDEMRDRFGAPPMPVQRLLEIMRIRALAGEAGLSALAAGKSGISAAFAPGRAPDEDLQTELRHHFGKAIELTWDKNKPGLQYRLSEGSNPLEAARALMEVLVAV